MTGTIKYEATVDLSERNSSHTMLHELAVASGGAALDILEVGCSSGYLGASLVEKGHRVTGVEPDEASASAARARLPEVFTGDFDQFLDANPGRIFDVVIFGDVLEHLVEPGAALERTRGHLSPDGTVVISVPNVAHGSVRAMLLEGRWDYADKGILDRTHLRFFTHGELARMLASTGYALERLHAVSLSAKAADREYGMHLAPELITAVELLDDNESRHAFQYVALARPASASAETLDKHNRSVPVEAMAPAPHVPGGRSLRQRLQVRVFRYLLREISRRRFRG